MNKLKKNALDEILPMDRIDDLNTLDLREMFGNTAGLYTLPNPNFVMQWKQPKQHYRKMIKDYHFTGNKHVLDIGGAWGRWAFFLAEVNSFVTVIDPMAYSLDVGKKVAEFLKIQNVFFLKGSAIHLSFPSLTFDAAWMFSVLFNLNRTQVLREVRRILRPNGRLFVGSFVGPGRLIQWLVEGYKQGGFDHIMCQNALMAMRRDDPYDSGPPNYGTKESLPGILQQNGFELETKYSVIDYKVGELNSRDRMIFDNLPQTADRFINEIDFREDIICRYKEIFRCIEMDFLFSCKKTDSYPINDPKAA